jgi:hypothetical protein
MALKGVLRPGYIQIRVTDLGLQPAVFGAALELTDIRDGDVRVL